MISVEAAKKRITDLPEMASQTISLADADGRVLSGDISAPIHLPPFNQASMDGYAIRFADHRPGHVFPVVASVAAGCRIENVLSPGTAVRIFTGAAIPEGADTIVMQEDTVLHGDGMQITSEKIAAGDHFRQLGAEIRKGDLAMLAGTRLGPSAIAYLAGMGITTVRVSCRPRVIVIVTGNELTAPGVALEPGRIYESASVGLRAALARLPTALIEIKTVGDDAAALSRTISESLEQCDLLLTTGGVSVGDYDFTVGACERAGVSTVFHRVRQKPGKPLYFGRKGEKLLFGLPGNPSSVLTCFYHYVVPAIGALVGASDLSGVRTATFAGSYRKNRGFTHFLKGKWSGSSVTVTGAQESYRLSGFAVSDCLIEVPEDVACLTDGDLVTVTSVV